MLSLQGGFKIITVFPWIKSADIRKFDIFRWGHYLKNFKFYVLNVPPILWKRGDIIQGRTLFKEIRNLVNLININESPIIVNLKFLLIETKTQRFSKFLIIILLFLALKWPFLGLSPPYTLWTVNDILFLSQKQHHWLFKL